MASCESCGAKVENPIKCKIEGVIFEVCQKCTSLGEIVKDKPVFSNKSYFSNNRYKKTEYVVIKNAPEIIKYEREKRKMRQIDLAKMLQIKESLIHHIETKEITLNIQLAKKIENTLNIKLVKELDEDEEIVL